MFCIKVKQLSEYWETERDPARLSHNSVPNSNAYSHPLPTN